MAEIVGFDRISVRFGEAGKARFAIRDLTLSIRQGEVFGIVGESGSGKTTALRVISGIQTATHGALRIDGQPVGHRRSLTQRRRMQMVFQDPYGSLHPRHDVDTILREPLAMHGIAATDAQIVTAMDDVGLPRALRYRYPNQLSGGQRQRVAIARALILEPALLLLDEPTSALDVSVQAEILNLFRTIRSARGVTMVLVSHDLGVVANLCDRLAVMREGELVEMLDVDDLSASRVRQAYTRELLVSHQAFRRGGSGRATAVE